MNGVPLQYIMHANCVLCCSGHSCSLVVIVVACSWFISLQLAKGHLSNNNHLEQSSKRGRKRGGCRWVSYLSGRALVAYARDPGFNSQQHHLSFFSIAVSKVRASIGLPMLHVLSLRFFQIHNTQQLSPILLVQCCMSIAYQILYTNPCRLHYTLL